MVETVRIRIDPSIKESLDKLKTDENDTYSRVIGLLRDQHVGHIDILAKKEQHIRDEYVEKIRDEYVERTIYDKLWCDYTENTEKIKELEDKIRDMNDKKKDLVVELKKQQDVNVDLQGVLTVREDELKDAHRESNDLKDELDELKVKHDADLSDMKQQYHVSCERYIHLREHLEQSYIGLDAIKTLYRIVWFLSRRRHSFFTIGQLTDKIAYNTRDEIADALALSCHRIFPVRKFLIKNVECYGFDRYYLKG